MADTSDHIPASAIRFHEAFERLLAVEPKAAEVIAELGRLERAKVIDDTQWADAYNKLEDIERDVADSFQEELSCGALNAYRRDRHTGQDLRVPAEEWKDAEIVAGDYKTFPPVYFLKVEFESWLKKIRGNTKKRGRPPKGRDAVDEARMALWGDAPIREAPSVARDMVTQWLFDKQKIVPSDDTILRGLGFKK